MIVSVCIISLSLALLVLLGGLFMLAYSKKEGLGMFSKIASYIAILFGSIAFVCGLACCTMFCGHCDDNKCEKRVEIHKEMHGGHCESGAMECHGEMEGAHCEKGEMECHEGMSAGHCEKGAEKDCCKEGKMVCKNADKGCCKDGVCKDADKGCCTAAKTECKEGDKACCKGDKKVETKVVVK